ncbi:hypothetical protein CORT_0C06080 [Candida orthopsilosis Co 90-125]|uniref:Uncharacterized protein n=1 Tax=Candida orthopsilosis (strain 90-125) TaxID=1136231 RepID=H8X429_CANO9|nr:hypothetical protein CORT_0C06080 [Candida orthopsilosis Co 90-125]CCG25981.1 hypothetical protein CORT_0C06080 [Candida orthopsilosis Co 90-125]
MVSNIWIAAADNQKEEVEKYISSGEFTANAKDPNGYTPIHAAAAYGHHDLIDYLVQHGGNINIQDNEGDTPLHHVEDVSTAKLLVEKYNADYKIKNNDGLIAANFIEEEDEFPEVATFLKSLIHDKPEDVSNEVTHANEFLESLPRPGTVDGREIKYSLQTEQQQQGDEDLSPEELEQRRKKIEEILKSENPEEGLRELITNAVHDGLEQRQQDNEEEPSSKRRK